MGLEASFWNLVAIVVYVLGVAFTHLRMRRPWMTWSSALLALVVDGQLIPFGAVVFGLVALFAKPAGREPQAEPGSTDPR